MPILFGYNARLDMPEDMIYTLISAFYKERDNLAKANPGFTPMAKDFIGMQVNGINANPDMVVHPGLAKFLKEHQAWSEKWQVGGAISAPRSSGAVIGAIVKGGGTSGPPLWRARR